MIKYLSFIGLLVFLISPVVRAQSFDTYMNPVIPGDHPDATLTRIGNDFYTTGSSFNVTPVIYHSTDLVHWEVIAQPVKASWSGYGDNPGGGCWGGHVVFYHDKYWHYFSRGNTMHFTTADQPEGPWSDPIVVNNPPELPSMMMINGTWWLKTGNQTGALLNWETTVSLQAWFMI